MSDQIRHITESLLGDHVVNGIISMIDQINPMDVMTAATHHHPLVGVTGFVSKTEHDACAETTAKIAVGGKTDLCVLAKIALLPEAADRLDAKPLWSAYITEYNKKVDDGLIAISKVAETKALKVKTNADLLVEREQKIWTLGIMWLIMFLPLIFDIGMAIAHTLIETQLRSDFVDWTSFTTWTYWNFVQLGISAVTSLFYVLLIIPTFLLIISSTDPDAGTKDNIMGSTWARVLFYTFNGFQFALIMCKIIIVTLIIGQDPMINPDGKMLPPEIVAILKMTGLYFDLTNEVLLYAFIAELVVDCVKVCVVLFNFIIYTTIPDVLNSLIHDVDVPEKKTADNKEAAKE